VNWADGVRGTHRVAQRSPTSSASSSNSAVWWSAA